MSIPAGLGIVDGTPPAGDIASGVVTGTFTAVGTGKPFSSFGQCNALLYASLSAAVTGNLVTNNGSSIATITTASTLAAGNSINSANLPAGTTIGSIAGTNITLSFPTITLYGQLTAQNQIINLPSTAGLLGASIGGQTVTAIMQAAIPASSNSNALAQPGIVQLSGVPTGYSISPQNQNFPFSFKLTNQSVTTGSDANVVFTGASIVFSGTVQIERSFDGGLTWIITNIGGTGVLAQYSAGTPVSLTFGEPERGTLYRFNCSAYASGTINYRMSASGAAAMSMSLGTPI